MPPSLRAVLRIFYRFLTALARHAVRSWRSKDLEIIVLRHQLRVPCRQVQRPTFNDRDRTLLGAIPSTVPDRVRQGWIVTPETLVRWYRRRIAVIASGFRRGRAIVTEFGRALVDDPNSARHPNYG